MRAGDYLLLDHNTFGTIVIKLLKKVIKPTACEERTKFAGGYGYRVEFVQGTIADGGISEWSIDTINEGQVINLGRNKELVEVLYAKNN